ncbi:MAG: glutaminyl-peptide cyclotransferase [Flavobacteriaceae bacterium]
MCLRKLLFLTILIAFTISCGSDTKTESNDFSLTSNASFNKNDQLYSISKDKTLELKINNPKKHTIDSVSYVYNNSKVNASVSLSDSKLGIQEVTATIYYNGTSQKLTHTIQVLNDESPKVFGFEIVNEYPHDITSYTQGLEFFNGELFESTGQRGESKLRKVDYKTSEVLMNVDLEPQYFGEGLTILNNKIYQLTWESKTGFVYDVESFEKIKDFSYNQSKEGWGICNDGNFLYKSDGTDKIWTLDPETLEEKDYIQTYTNKGKIVGINELEWINGKIYANRYQLDGVAIINPKNGAIEGVIDFRSLKKKVTQHQGLDVLNGLAWNSETQTLFVTGKRWDKLFEVRITEK